MRLENGKLIIKLTLHEPRLSTSGKTFVVGGTRGVRKSQLKIDGGHIFYIANAYIKKESRRSSIKELAKRKKAVIDK